MSSIECDRINGYTGTNAIGNVMITRFCCNEYLCTDNITQIE
jgi:hypothetical protein